MEKAYHTKCIELKRRLREIEEANEAAALRKLRLDRAISKLRITRAFLVEQVAKVQFNPDAAETDKSESPPPTVLYNPSPFYFDPPTQGSQQPLPQYHAQQPNHWFKQPLPFNLGPPSSDTMQMPLPLLQVPFPPLQDPYFNSLQQPVMDPSPSNPLPNTSQLLYDRNEANNKPSTKPQARPARVKRVTRRSSPGLAEGHRSSIHMEPPQAREVPREVYPAAVDGYSVRDPPPIQIAPALHHRAPIPNPGLVPPLQALAAAHVQPHPSPLAGRQAHSTMVAVPPVRYPVYEAAMAEMLREQQEQLPRINSLPNGTSVMLIGPGEPKPAPWTIRDLGPQHQIHPGFEAWEPERQEHYLFDEQTPYLPYDVYGRAVCVNWDKTAGRYVHVFPGDPAYIDPVKGNIRTDTPDRKRRIVLDHIMAQRAQQEKVQQREHHRRESREFRGGNERPSTSERRESGRERKDRESRGPVVAGRPDDNEVLEVAAPATAAGRSSLDGAVDDRAHRRGEPGRDSVASAAAVSPSGNSPPAGAGGFTAANAPGGPAGR